MMIKYETKEDFWNGANTIVKEFVKNQIMHNGYGKELTGAAIRSHLLECHDVELTLNAASELVKHYNNVMLNRMNGFPSTYVDGKPPEYNQEMHATKLELTLTSDNANQKVNLKELLTDRYPYLITKSNVQIHDIGIKSEFGNAPDKVSTTTHGAYMFFATDLHSLELDRRNNQCDIEGVLGAINLDLIIDIGD